MGKKSRFNPTDVRQGNSRISPTKISGSEGVNFNFKNLTEKGKKFKYTSKSEQYFCKMLERLKLVCGISKQNLMTSHSKSLRCHKIDFRESNVSEHSFGLGQEMDDTAYQFEISSNAHGRVHGYFIDNTFYIVWFDPEHELYPGNR